MNSPDLFSLAALQDELFHLVHDEHAAQRNALRRIWAQPLEDRIEEGRCLVNLRVREIRTDGTFLFACPQNDSRFREGDFVRLSKGNPECPVTEAIFVAGDDEQVELRLWGGADKSASVPVGSDGWQLDESSADLEKLYLGALEDLGKTAVGRERILPLLDGSRKPVLDLETFESGFEAAKQNGFDDQQAEAMASAVASDLAWLIHGPPGTGKTSVLAWIVADLVKKGERVLVTSLTHRAINNLLEAIATRLDDSRLIAKITPFIAPGFSLPQFESFSESPLSRSGSGYVIGATPFALRSKRLRGVDFDTVIIDEASQVTVPLAIMAMLAGKRYFFAGDHQQLPPVTLTRSAQEAVSLSIFGRLIGKGFDTMLTASRRLNDALCEWPSETFYLSRLFAHPQAATRRLSLNDHPSKWADVLDPNRPLVWISIPHVECRTQCREEAHVVGELLHELQSGGLSWANIGVVVPFRRQARLIRRQLGSKGRPAMGLGSLVVDTVERMQGQEREVILVSFTTFDLDFAVRLAEFLFQPQRLNVAATRPRTKLILLASPELVQLADIRSTEEVGAGFAALLNRAHRVEVPLPA